MIQQLDHLVLTTADETACIRFYVDVLGMTLESFQPQLATGELGEPRKALKFGQQKINIHLKGKEFEPKACFPTCGALDLCFLASQPLDQVIERLCQHDITIIEGPVIRTGAVQKIRSVYVRDPDGNLIEISEPVDS
ncbi:Virulence protein [Vibrio mangrovi]|uniref:VOC family protein n=2 Tax=Vibrio mangrovi TaxID=474394 RepID=A0A1Y6IRE7_9VIBR|nr:VOC family protein [Vibrio mangrovi]MDW6003587.1 VOC family protein [Vibrio mangrovi]SMR99621.1 Virulence protein [Vibrio mangrovi]